ncbi:hypothetical protein [Streptomyces triticagri]|uniref:hypothetical protein n=1 Tax=Streptomyces triticagri TaxID=2293568 RepID=UPI001314E174|nr:hypothetical protein [Streptomyces triticagri]
MKTLLIGASGFLGRELGRRGVAAVQAEHKFVLRHSLLGIPVYAIFDPRAAL